MCDAMQMVIENKCFISSYNFSGGQCKNSPIALLYAMRQYAHHEKLSQNVFKPDLVCFIRLFSFSLSRGCKESKTFHFNADLINIDTVRMSIYVLNKGEIVILLISFEFNMYTCTLQILLDIPEIKREEFKSVACC